MQVGIISFAHMHGLGYARQLQHIDGVELAGIYDNDQDRGRGMAERFDVPFFDDYKELLALENIEAVIVTSENARHLEHVTAAAAAGKHVLCEKPIASTVQDAARMIEACRRGGVLLQTAFPVRYHPVVQRTKQWIEEGKLGRILAVMGTNHGKNPGGWFTDPAESGGGAVMDHTVHVADLLRWFLGAEVVSVYAEISGMMTGGNIDDCGIVTLEFDNGAFATIDCSWSRTPSFPAWGDVTLKLVGTEGILNVDVFGQKLNVYSERTGAEWAYWGDDMDDGLVREFVQSIRERRQPLITGEDGLKALEVVAAAYESQKRHQAVYISEFSLKSGEC